MPFFVRIGHIPTNAGKVGSRGYQLVRSGKTVISSWGPVEVLPNRSFHWCRKPQTKEFPCKSEAEAREMMKIQAKRRVESEGYSKLPSGVRIRSPRSKDAAKR